MEYKATDIPGKKLYDKEFNIQIRPVTPIEQKYIISLSQKEQKTTLDYINFLKKLIVIDNPEVQFEQLYWYDVQYLLYRIRYLTYTKFPLRLGFRCSECGEKIEHTLDIGTLNINEPENIQRTIILDNLGEHSIRNKWVGDDLVVEEFAKRKEIEIDQNNIQNRLLLLDLLLISTPEYNLDRLYSMAEEGTITASDVATIEQWFADNEWGIDEEVIVKCPKCKKEASRGYVLSIEDFFSIV